MAVELPQVVALDHLCFGGLWTADGYHREIDSPNSDLLILSHSPAGDRPTSSPSPADLIGVACSWAILDEAHITLLGIHPHYQRQGLGQVLLLCLLQMARHRGLQWATLEVRVSNTAARSLYDRYGFQEAGRRTRYYADTGEDAVILWCKGLQTNEVGDRFDHHWHRAAHRLQHHDWVVSQSTQAIAFTQSS